MHKPYDKVGIYELRFVFPFHLLIITAEVEIPKLGSYLSCSLNVCCGSRIFDDKYGQK